MKIDANLLQLRADRNITLTSSPFAPGKVIVKKASFPKGEVPPHLTPYLIKTNPCKGVTGTTIYNGKLVPSAAACLAEKRKGMKKK